MSFSDRPVLTRLGIAALIFIIPLIYYFPATLGDVLLAPGDGWSQIFGIRVLIGKMVAKGEVPLWNPYIFAGMPLLASIQPGALYPPSWLFAWFTPKAAMNMMVITTYHLALWGTYLYARRVGQSRLGALVAGIAFAFGGYMVSHLGHSNRIAAAAWLPWIILSVEELYRRPRWRWITLGAFCIALQLFAGEPQMTCYTAIVAGAYTLFSFTLREAPASRGRLFAALCAMCVCGGLLSAIQLLPEGEMLRHTERIAITYHYFSQFSLPPQQLVGLWFPYFFGGSAFSFYKVTYWGRWNPTETASYVGMLVWLFVFIAVGLRRKTKVQWFWLVWAIIALGLAMGDNLPFNLYYVLYHVPVYNLFRAPGRHLLEFNFAIGLLAGFGITALAQFEVRARYHLAAFSSVLLGLIVAIIVGLYCFAAERLKLELPVPKEVGAIANTDVLVPLLLFALSVVALFAFARKPNVLMSAVVVVLVAADAMSYGYFYEWRLQSFDLAKRMSDPPSVKFIKDREPDWRNFRILSQSPLPYGKSYDMLDFPNVSMTRHLQTVNGYDPMRLLRTTNIAGHMSLDGWVEEPESFATPHRGFDLLNVKYLLLEPASAERVKHEGIEFDAEPNRYSFKPGMSSVFKVSTLANELALITNMGDSVHLKTGTPVAEIKLTADNGRVFTHQIQAGRDTAEWAYDRDAVRAAIQHARPKVIESWMEPEFEGHRYLARFKFDRATITQIEVTYIAPDANLNITRATLFDSETNQSFPLSNFNVPTERWQLLQQFDSVTVYENLHYLPRAWFVKRWHVASSDDVLETIKTGKLKDGSAFDPRETVLLEREIYGEQPAKLSPPGDPTGAEVKLVRYEPHHIELTTKNPQNGFLVLSEVYYRGWEALIDGQRVPVERVNYTLRGLPVPAGEHNIRFVFRSPTFRNGAAYSLVGLLLLFVGGVFGRKLETYFPPTSSSDNPPDSGLDSPASAPPPPNTSGVASGLNRISTKLKPFKLFSLLFFLALAIYFGWLLRNGAYGVGGSDSAGYANLTRSLTQWNFIYQPEALKALELSPDFLDCFRPLGTVPGQHAGTLAPFYSIGYPLHMAAGALLIGWRNGPFIINPLLAALGVLLMYLLGLELGLKRGYALAGTALLALYPIYLFMTMQPMSDLPATFYALLALWAALRTQHHERWALLAGAAFGMAILIRPTSVLLLLPLAFALRLNWRAWLHFGVGGFPLALFFFAFNQRAYGGWLTTGYGTAGYFDLMKASYFAPRFRSYLHWLVVSLSPLPLLGWAALFVFPRESFLSPSGRKRALLLTWFGGFFLFYCFYEIYEGWSYLRFLLPGIPALFLGMLLVLQSLAEKLSAKTGLAVATVACLIVLGVGLNMTINDGITETGKGHYLHVRSSRWAHQQLPPDSIVISEEMSAALRFYGSRPILRWDLTSPERWKIISTRLKEKSWRCYALLMSHEIEKAQSALPGQWKRMGDYQNVSLWQVETNP